ncbi:hypothetical protein [Raineyella fluvialis]|uniref:Uncharacterized protein n=1 Tax=Raineyella fluvialis TaxID=2662261 RepID=A0A5Q2FD66_9ACTN|nr:hypothetical protein [Raineyella fluvialis]QGF24738.1 hypothetical protein Rai3103_15115 [Raineyella fluvialis]
MMTPTAALAAARAAVKNWREQLTAAEADVNRLAAPVTDPEQAAQVARERVTARELVSIYRDGLQAAQTAAEAAEKDVLTARLNADAAALDPAITAAQEAHDKHAAQVADLLNRLGELAGTEVTLEDPNGEQLAANLAYLTGQRDALRVAANGGDPTTVCPLDRLPAALQIDGYAPCVAARTAAANAAWRAREDAAERDRVERMRARALEDIDRATAESEEQARRSPWLVRPA